MGCRWNRLDEPIFVAVSFFGLTGILYLEKFYALWSVIGATRLQLKTREYLEFSTNPSVFCSMAEKFRLPAADYLPVHNSGISVKKNQIQQLV